MWCCERDTIRSLLNPSRICVAKLLLFCVQAKVQMSPRVCPHLCMCVCLCIPYCNAVCIHSHTYVAVEISSVKLLLSVPTKPFFVNFLVLILPHVVRILQIARWAAKDFVSPISCTIKKWAISVCSYSKTLALALHRSALFPAIRQMQKGLKKIYTSGTALCRAVDLRARIFGNGLKACARSRSCVCVVFSCVCVLVCDER